jgi:hypothetical protein
MPLDKTQLKSIISPTSYDDAKLQTIVDALNETFNRYSIDTNKRMCHFLA